MYDFLPVIIFLFQFFFSSLLNYWFPYCIHLYTWSIQQVIVAQQDKNIIIVPAGKGNANCRNGILQQIGGLDWQWWLKKDPILKTERKLSQILGKKKDLIPQTKYRQLIQPFSKLPHIYGLPKIHKDGIPLRPIVCNRGSPIEPLHCGDHQPTNLIIC